MHLLENNASRVRFEVYIEQLASVIGHADRVVPLHDYCTGPLLPGERKSVEPMAALTAPARTDGQALGVTVEAVARGRDGQFIPAGICWVVSGPLPG